MGYMDPATEGTTLTFDCLPEYILNGPNTTTYMGNGKWEPDPREVECKLEGIITIAKNLRIQIDL